MAYNVKNSSPTLKKDLIVPLFTMNVISVFVHANFQQRMSKNPQKYQLILKKRKSFKLKRVILFKFVAFNISYSFYMIMAATLKDTMASS